MADSLIGRAISRTSFICPPIPATAHTLTLAVMRPAFTTMKDLSSGQTFFTKYLVTAVWIIGPIVTAIIVYNKFGQVEGFYMIPILYF